MTWKDDKQEIEELLGKAWAKLIKMKDQYDELYPSEERYLSIVHNGIRDILTKTAEVFGPAEAPPFMKIEEVG